MDDKLKIFKTIDPVVLFLLLLYFFTKNDFLFFVALVLISCNVFFIDISGIFAKYWLKFAMFLGVINSKVILTVVYTFLLTPLSYFFRIFNPISVLHFKRRRRETYYNNHSIDIEPVSFEKQW